MMISSIRNTDMYSPMQNVNQSQKNVNELREKQQEEKERIEELASGKKVNDAADDPAIMAIAQKMLSANISFETRNQTIDYELGSLDVADGALSGVQDNLSRMNELTLQASNDTLSDSDKAIIQKEIDQLSEQMSSTFSSTQFNTQSVFNSDTTSMSAESLGMTDFSIATISASGMPDFSELNEDALSQLASASASVSSLQSQIGATSNGLQSEQNVNQITANNTLSALSQMQDTDYAESSSALIKNNLLAQYQMQMESKMLQQLSTFQIAL
ncbi:MAG: hypothetical protein BEN19_02335 [Epulopiscium sp. Nuni2H_MBin003]|nr:MAG: hypothetical protein BEN19_02335 [Epulopiscium sp. Nuni2H_MBin003]